jgi:phage terminase small subunit
MPGRHAHPLNLLIADGKKHLTKKEKERRKKNIDLPDGEIKCPPYIKRNTAAYEKWKEILPILDKAKLIKPADAGSFARYCMAHAEYLDLIRQREEIAHIEEFTMDEEFKIASEFENNVGAKEAAKMWKKVEFIFSVQALLSIDKAINQKMATILALEDRFFLNILSRIKNILPEPEEKPEDPLEKKGFGNI